MFAIFPKIHQCVQTRDIENLAILVRHYFLKEQARLPALNLPGLLCNAGFSVKPSNLDYQGALVVLDQGGNIRPTLLHRERLSGFEKSFLLAHMLGHFFLHVQEKIVAGSFQTEAYYEKTSPLLRYTNILSKGESESEDIADNFAAALFLPQKMLEKALVKTEDNSEQVSKLFAVPTNCLRARKHALSPNEFQAKITKKEENLKPQEKLLESQKVEAGINHHKRASTLIRKIQELKQPTAIKEGPFKRLRQLAKKIDDGVDI